MEMMHDDDQSHDELSQSFNVAIVSRIFYPEPAVAANAEYAFAKELAARGHHVDVLTTSSPKFPAQETPGINVSRWPAIRDKNGYIRGIIQYLSFDVPAFFRVLTLRPKPDFILVEPPPTTGFVVKIAGLLRRIPYGYRVADLWSQAVTDQDTNKLVQKLLHWAEKVVLCGASVLLPVHEGVADRLKDFGLEERPEPIGLGVDTDTFRPEGETIESFKDKQILLYAGTASAVHGAEIFVEAFNVIKDEFPDSQLVFLGQGTSFEAVANAAEESAGRIIVHDRVSSLEAAKWIRSSKATLASVAPEKYGFAFPTKVYASVACGVPVIYAGAKHAGKIIASNELGIACDYSVSQLVAAMREILASSSKRSDYLRNWAIENISISSVAKRVADRIIDFTKNTRVSRTGYSRYNDCFD